MVHQMSNQVLNGSVVLLEKLSAKILCQDNQPYLGSSDISNHFVVHVNERVGFGLSVEAGEGGDKVHILGGPRNGSAGNDGRFSRERHC